MHILQHLTPHQEAWDNIKQYWLTDKLIGIYSIYFQSHSYLYFSMLLDDADSHSDACLPVYLFLLSPNECEWPVKRCVTKGQHTSHFLLSCRVTQLYTKPCLMSSDITLQGSSTVYKRDFHAYSEGCIVDGGILFNYELALWMKAL